jgi:hypothetical protein
MTELEAGLEAIRRSPKDHGMLEMIVRRPAVNEREVLEQADLDLAEGLVGDRWGARGSRRAENQLNLMNSRVIALVAQAKDRWPLAGDQLFVDLDLSAENLPPGTRLAIGSAVIEVTAEPHTGCKKFKARYGTDAHKFVNAAVTKDLHLRGICAKVVRSGTILAGDVIRKL